ncbi:MAG TPA: ABC transporter ATP-binding protein [Pirellulales bacterium]|jgi:ATP-binding cassette subfamily B protein/subfamily B ATP-binding cassette protein MsbA|nr:ABC transporter ATP-binding protein [Pirellulales bacterium]
MKNFSRALRLALRYRWTFAASIACALMIAVLWGGNIGTVYPVVEVAFQGQSLHEWTQVRIRDARARSAAIEAQLAALQSPPAGEASQGPPAAGRQELERQLAASQHTAAMYGWLKQNLVEPYLPDDAFGTLVIIVGILLLGTLVKSGFMVWHAVLVNRLAQLAALQLRNIFYRRTLAMEIARFGNEGTADLMNRFTSDMESLAAGMNELFGKLVREPLKMFACLLGAALVCWRLLFISLVIAPLAMLLIRWLAKAIKRANRRAMEEMSQMYNTLEETFQGVKVVKAFTMERLERRRFHLNSKQYFFKSLRIARYDSLTRPLVELLGVLTIAVALLAGAYLTINRETHLLGIRICEEPLSLSKLFLFYGLLAGMSDPARKLSEVFSRIQRGSAAADRIYQLIDRVPQIVDPPQPAAIGRHCRDLVFDAVQFHYHASHRVLEDVSLHIPFGETIAIVGPNGCGKSTLVNLILRFFDPIGGSVRLDGVDIRHGRLNDLRRQIGLVTQETLLFDDTVFNNIRYGSTWAPPEKVYEAAQQALAHRFIEERLEHGYQTVVGPKGARLSGGQRQRIALARAILRDPAILILDEATSQVDLESEQAIHRVLEQFIRGRTTVMISHRMSTLSLADRIVVMNAGRILDVGSHEQLLRRCELYGRLHDIQFKEIA